MCFCGEGRRLESKFFRRESPNEIEVAAGLAGVPPVGPPLIGCGKIGSVGLAASVLCVVVEDRLYVSRPAENPDDLD
jgi:hypothetical protein